MPTMTPSPLLPSTPPGTLEPSQTVGAPIHSGPLSVVSSRSKSTWTAETPSMSATSWACARVSCTAMPLIASV